MNCMNNGKKCNELTACYRYTRNTDRIELVLYPSGTKMIVPDLQRYL